MVIPLAIALLGGGCFAAWLALTDRDRDSQARAEDAVVAVVSGAEQLADVCIVDVIGDWVSR